MPQERLENRPRYTPVRVLGVFVISMLAVTLMTGLQHRRRELLETTQAPTAVGDAAYFEVKRPIIWERAMAERDGQALYLQSEEAQEWEDVQMLKVAWWRWFHLYELKGEPGRTWVKVAKGRYLPLGEQRRSAE